MNCASISSSLARLASLSLPVLFFFLMAQASMAQGTVRESAAPAPILTKEYPSPVNGPGVKARPEAKVKPAVQAPSANTTDAPPEVISHTSVAPIDPGQSTQPKGTRNSACKEQTVAGQKK